LALFVFGFLEAFCILSALVLVFFFIWGLRLAALGGATLRGSLAFGPTLAALRAGLAAKAATASHR
jgi:hypothetical protein